MRAFLLSSRPRPMSEATGDDEDLEPVLTIKRPVRLNLGFNLACIGLG